MDGMGCGDGWCCYLAGAGAATAAAGAAVVGAAVTGAGAEVAAPAGADFLSTAKRCLSRSFTCQRSCLARVSGR